MTLYFDEDGKLTFCPFNLYDQDSPCLRFESQLEPGKWMNIVTMVQGGDLAKAVLSNELGEVESKNISLQNSTEYMLPSNLYKITLGASSG